MNIRNVRDALKLCVGESKDSERQTCVKPGTLCVTFSGRSAGEAQQHKYTLKQITGFLGGVRISILLAPDLLRPVAGASIYLYDSSSRKSTFQREARRPVLFDRGNRTLKFSTLI